MLQWWDRSTSLPEPQHLHQRGGGAVGGRGPARSMVIAEGRAVMRCLMISGVMMTCLTTSLWRAPHRSTKVLLFKMCIFSREVTYELQLTSRIELKIRFTSEIFSEKLSYMFASFFMADKYYRADLQTKRVSSVTPPYPRSIAKYWLGCKDEEMPDVSRAEKK